MSFVLLLLLLLFEAYVCVSFEKLMLIFYLALVFTDLTNKQEREREKYINNSLDRTEREGKKRERDFFSETIRGILYNNQLRNQGHCE